MFFRVQVYVYFVAYAIGRIIFSWEILENLLVTRMLALFFLVLLTKYYLAKFKRQGKCYTKTQYMLVKSLKLLFRKLNKQLTSEIKHTYLFSR